METVSAASTRLREAIAARSFERAGTLLGEYGRALQVALEAASPAAKRAAVAEAVELLADLRRLALAHRAHLAARFDELNRLTPYLKSTPPPRRWQMEG
jgi:hypothetical protein